MPAATPPPRKVISSVMLNIRSCVSFSVTWCYDATRFCIVVAHVLTLLHICNLPGKLSLETLLAWILVEFWSHEAAMLAPFLEIFAYFWTFFEVRSHFGSVL